MFAVREAPPILILLAILAPTSFTASINYEILEPVDTFRSRKMIEVTPFTKTMLIITSIIITEHWYGKIDKDHHDLDKRHGYYDNEDDGEKDDHRDDNYYEGKGGEKGENFEENGHYRKGYSSHQYKKYKDFYDEDYDSDFDERNGGRYYNEGRHDCNE